jgi:hypothetical protein
MPEVSKQSGDRYPKITGYARQQAGKYRNFLKSNRLGSELNRAFRAARKKFAPARKLAEALAFRG